MRLRQSVWSGTAGLRGPRGRRVGRRWSPSSVALGSIMRSGLGKNGTFYSGTPLRGRIDVTPESLARLSGSAVPAVGCPVTGEGSCAGGNGDGAVCAADSLVRPFRGNGRTASAAAGRRARVNGPEANAGGGRSRLAPVGVARVGRYARSCHLGSVRSNRPRSPWLVFWLAPAVLGRSGVPGGPGTPRTWVPACVRHVLSGTVRAGLVAQTLLAS